MRKIRFNKSLNKYVKKGDVLDMESQIAARLVKQKRAEYFEGKLDETDDEEAEIKLPKKRPKKKQK